MGKKTNKQYRKFCESSRRHWTFMSYKISHRSKAISEINILNYHWDYWAFERCKVLNSIPKSIPDWLLEQNIPVLCVLVQHFGITSCVCVYILNPYSFSLLFLLPTTISKSDQFFLFSQCSLHAMFTHFHPRPFVLLTFSSSPFFIFTSFSFSNFLFSHHNSPDFPTFLSSYKFKVSVYFFQLLPSLANINHLKLSIFCCGSGS